MKLQKSSLLTISAASLLLSALVSGNVFAEETTPSESTNPSYVTTEMFADLIDYMNNSNAATYPQIYETLEDHNGVLSQHGTSITQLENDLVNYTKQLDTYNQEVNTIVQEKLQAHDEDLANKADKAEVGESFNKLYEYNKNVDKTLNEYYKVLNAHDELLNNHADRIEEIIAKKADTNQVNLNTARIQDVEDRTSKLYQKLRHGLAAQAALTGLFQPYNVGKANISAAVGGYRSTTAVAVGTGYRFNEHVATKAGVAFSTGGNRAVSYHAGVNYEW